MSMNILLRGLDDQVFNNLKQTATLQKISMNKLILNLLYQSLGFQVEQKARIYHDLDYLAGTWSNKEAKEFLNTISDFEKIDEELWK